MWAYSHVQFFNKSIQGKRNASSLTSKKIVLLVPQESKRKMMPVVWTEMTVMRLKYSVQTSVLQVPVKLLYSKQ